MASTQPSELYFLTEITNGSLSIAATDSITKLSINNPSSVNGTVTGTWTVQGAVGTGVTIHQNESITLCANDGSVLAGIVITAPAGCTLQIEAAN